MGFVVESGFMVPPSTLLLLSLQKRFGILLTPHESLCSGPSGAVIQKTEDPCRDCSSPCQIRSRTLVLHSPIVSLVDDHS